MSFDFPDFACWLNMLLGWMALVRFHVSFARVTCADSTCDVFFVMRNGIDTAGFKCRMFRRRPDSCSLNLVTASPSQDQLVPLLVQTNID